MAGITRTQNREEFLAQEQVMVPVRHTTRRGTLRWASKASARHTSPPTPTLRQLLMCSHGRKRLECRDNRAIRRPSHRWALAPRPWDAALRKPRRITLCGSKTSRTCTRTASRSKSLAQVRTTTTSARSWTLPQSLRSISEGSSSTRATARPLFIGQRKTM